MVIYQLICCVNKKLKRRPLNMPCTPKVKVTFGVFFMAKISKQIKLKAILEYISGNGSKTEIARRYGINRMAFQMLLAAYSTHGADVLFNPPEPTGAFRVELASWAIKNNQVV